MARRTFDVIDVIEILIHWYAGRSQNELAQSLGVDRKTLRKYIAPAVAAGMVPGGPPMAEARLAARWCAEWFPQLADTRLRQVSWPAIEPHRDYIAAQLKAGVTVATIHQRLRDEHGLAVSVASLRRWVRGEPARGGPPGAGDGAAATPRRPGARRRSTTGGWGCGSTRRPGGGARCGRS